MRPVAVAVAVAIWLGGPVTPTSIARADTATAAEHRPDHVVIDRVDVRPSILPGLARVRALVSATQLRGQRIETSGAKLIVKVPGAKPVFVTGYFATADVELSLVVLVPTTLEFEPEFDLIKDHIDGKLLAPLKGLGPRLRVQIIGYGGNFSGSKGLVSVDAARKALAALYGDGSSDPPDLVEALKRAVKAAAAGLRGPKTKGAVTRAAIVVVSSGATITPENEDLKDKLTRLGTDADKANVRVHTLGYVPVAVDGAPRPRRPLLALGELSRRSHGVFRWIQTSAGWAPAFAQLTEQMALQYVVTFFAPAEELIGKKLSVTVPLGDDKIESEPAKLGEPKCGKEICLGNAYCVDGECVARRVESGPSGLAWTLLIGAGVALVVVVTSVGTWLRRRRRNPAAAMPAAPVARAHPFAAQPGGHPAPAAVAPPIGGPILLILTGPAAGHRMPLRAGFLIGKAAGSDLDLSHDGFASTHHAQIGFDAGVWTVTDRGSTNGTFANGVRITASRLDHGMTIRFGSTDVRFWIQE